MANYCIKKYCLTHYYLSQTCISLLFHYDKSEKVQLKTIFCDSIHYLLNFLGLKKLQLGSCSFLNMPLQ